MTRILIVSLLAALLCMGLTGLRVTLLQRIATPGTPGTRLLSPRQVKAPAPPAPERPIEYVARAPALRSARAADAALLWQRPALPPTARDTAAR
jgi:hypothetical protein